MTIFELLQDLRRAEPEAMVRFDFACLVPTTIASSRGDYAKPALGWKIADCTDVVPTVSDLIAELEQATDGRKYAGWKGGEYSFSSSDFLCVDNPGEWTETDLVRVEDRGWRVILHTRIEG